MKHYIDKDTLAAEINRLIRRNELYLDDNVPDTVRFQKTGAYSVLCDLQHFLGSLEVKEEDYNDCIHKDAFIDKACEWLESHNGYLRIHDNGRGVRFDMTQCVIDFRKAMKE